jgi:glycosyltransferase involved in cell wall biosynthesis
MRLLLAGDFTCHSGFARVNEALAAHLHALGWDIAVLAVNYDGDYHPLGQQYRLWPAVNAGDVMGVRRLADLIARERPDVVLIVNDPWIVRRYLASLATVDDAGPPIVAYMPVDATALRRRDVEPLNGLAHAIAYTQFGLTELRRSGLDIDASVIGHGIDTDVFFPVDQVEARNAAGMGMDIFAVLIFDRNQARKRLDIAFDAFARFAKNKPTTVKLVYHGSLADEARTGWAIEDMAADLGIADRLILTARDIQPLRGVATDQLKVIYSMCDVKLSTSSGEGWGLTTMEAMACGLPNVLPNNSALAEWAADAALMVDCPIPVRHAGGINTVGSVPDAETAAEALEQLYHHAEWCGEYAARGLTLVDQERFRWPIIARQFDHVLRQAAAQRAEVAA